MEVMKINKTIIIAALSLMMTVSAASFVFGAVTAEEAAQLGKNLTQFGSERAGNKDGTIPAYTGGLTTPPASYKPGSGRYTDPFAGEKPLFSINAQNMNQYAAKLTEGTKALIKRYPAYRIDVYKTHRTMAYPESILKNTEKCALTAKTAHGGYSLEGARACIAFPIPKDGFEVMWNHNTSYKGRGWEGYWQSFIRDNSGRLTLSGACLSISDYPFFDERVSAFDKPYYFKEIASYQEEAPARLIGNVYMNLDPLDTRKMSRLAYMYLPGQRRVRLAPELDFDTPSSEASGNMIYDEMNLFSGSMQKYDWKLIGKKEMYIPYNDYRAAFWVPWDQLIGPHYFNPDFVRWELHRVWVVEANLVKGDRHIYPKRRLYIDEDSWRAHATELYDAMGTLVKTDYAIAFQAYDKSAMYNNSLWDANLISGAVHTIYGFGPKGWLKFPKPLSPREWAPEALAGRSEGSTGNPSILSSAGRTNVSKLSRHPSGLPGNKKTGTLVSVPSGEERFITPNETVPFFPTLILERTSSPIFPNTSLTKS
jgi:hypothetical protein